jgi:hypothetical protein
VIARTSKESGARSKDFTTDRPWLPVAPYMVTSFRVWAMKKKSRGVPEFEGTLLVWSLVVITHSLQYFKVRPNLLVESEAHFILELSVYE